MLKCYIENRNLIDGTPKEFNIAEGAVFTENYNETLDSGTIIIPQLTEKIEIDSYDVIVIYSDNSKIEQKRFCIDSYQCTQVCLIPPIYNYEISLFSETKGLEGILLPSLAITKKKSGDLRKVIYYLEYYLGQYNIYQSVNSVGGLTSPKYSFGHNILDENDTVLNRFNQIDCPEMQWNEPTLREVLNDLMMVDDCIPVVKNNVIHFIDISQTLNEITDNQKKFINTIIESQSSDDYVSELKMNLRNSVNNELPTGSYSDSDSENLPLEVNRNCEEIGFRNSESYIINTENLRVETQYPIWNLLYCAVFFRMSASLMVYDENGNLVSGVSGIKTYNVGYILKDSSVNLIPEYGEWETKNILFDPFGQNQYPSDIYQNTCLFYRRGSNIIDNFNAKQEDDVLWIKDQVSLYEMIIRDASKWKTAFIEEGKKQYPGYARYDAQQFGTWPSNLENNGSFKNARFKIIYQSIDDTTFLASKQPFSQNKRQVMDNQTNSYIDINRQGFLEYLKAKRLGNKISIVNGRTLENESSLPTLAQKINDKVIFNKQISVFNSYIGVNYQCVENYVLRDYFTGVKSKLRSWKILDGNEAFTRADILKFYFNNNLSSINNSTRIIPVYNDLDTYLENFKYCAIRFYASNGDTYPSSTYITYNGTDYNINLYLIEFNKRKCGKSVLFTIKLKDNAVVGRYVYYRDGDGGMQQKNCKYVDDNGENIGGVIYFFKEFNPVVPATSVTGDSQYAISAALKPGINNTQMSNIVAQIPFDFRKDNKEITQITIQFELNEEANNVVLGKTN